MLNVDFKLKREQGTQCQVTHYKVHIFKVPVHTNTTDDIIFLK